MKQCKYNNIAVVIVSYNRRVELLNNITVVKKISVPKFDIIVVDNASTDGTKDAIKDDEDIIYLNTKINLGGAGGFKYGMKYAYENNYDYIWCLDDDGEPRLDALNNLLKESKRIGDNSILGPQILSDKDTFNSFWPVNKPYDIDKRIIELYPNDRLNNIFTKRLTVETATVALMGMFLHRNVISTIGYPDEELFISNDDVEYCLRAKIQGLNIFLVNSAEVYHPALKLSEFRVLHKKIKIILMSDFKIYYYVRNIIIVNNKYFSFTHNIKTILILILTIFVNFVKNGFNFNVLTNGLKGFVHGFTERKGVI